MHPITLSPSIQPPEAQIVDIFFLGGGVRGAECRKPHQWPDMLGFSATSEVESQRPEDSESPQSRVKFAIVPPLCTSFYFCKES